MSGTIRVDAYGAAGARDAHPAHGTRNSAVAPEAHVSLPRDRRSVKTGQCSPPGFYGPNELAHGKSGPRCDARVQRVTEMRSNSAGWSRGSRARRRF